MDDSVASLIRRHMPPVPVPTIPEVRLHLAGPRSGLGRRLPEASEPPYWAHVWGGGLVLARYVLDNPALVERRSVLDLGTGSGLVAIAAALAGATAVTALDIDPRAVAAARLNAALNGVSIEVLCTDRLDGPPPLASLVLVGDLFYDASLSRRVSAFLDRCVAAGRTVLIGDPGRRTLPLARLALLHETVAPDFGSHGRCVPSRVFTYGA